VTSLHLEGALLYLSNVAGDITTAELHTASKNTKLLSTGAEVADLFVAQSMLYWLQKTASGYSLNRAGIDGKNSTQIGQFGGSPNRFVAAGDRLLWSSSDGVFAYNSQDAVAEQLYPADPGQAVKDVAFTSGNIYWADGTTIYKGDLNKTARKTQVSDQAGIFRMVADKDDLFWTLDVTVGQVMRQFLVSGETKPLSNLIHTNPKNISLDDSFVYYSVSDQYPPGGLNPATGRILKISRDKGGPIGMVTGPLPYDTMAISPVVYCWSYMEKPTIYRVNCQGR
jgi:hypothetical protein